MKCEQFGANDLKVFCSSLRRKCVINKIAETSMFMNLLYLASYLTVSV